MVRPMDGRQPKSLFLQHIPSVQHGSPERSGSDAPKHGTKRHAHAPFWAEYHCDPSTPRPLSPITKGPFRKLHKHCTNTGSLIDVSDRRVWTLGHITTVSILCLAPASSDVGLNAQVILLSVYGHGFGPTNHFECWVPASPPSAKPNNTMETIKVKPTSEEVEYLEAPYVSQAVTNHW